MRRRKDLAAQYDVPMQFVLAQIEEAIFEPQFLRRRIGFGIDRDRQRLSHRLDGHVVGVELDRAGGEARIDRRGVTGDHLAAHRDHALGPHLLGGLEHRAGAVHHHLGDAIMVAQVDEQQIAVIALALHPARKPGRLADMVRPQLAAGMGSVDGRHHVLPGFCWAGKRHGLCRQVKQTGHFGARDDSGLCRRPSRPL
jgi:hypothetical protein